MDLVITKRININNPNNLAFTRNYCNDIINENKVKL